MSLTQEQLITILSKQAQKRISEMDYDTLFEYAVTMFKREMVDEDGSVDENRLLWDVFDTFQGDENEVFDFLNEQCGIDEDTTKEAVSGIFDIVRDTVERWFNK